MMHVLPLHYNLTSQNTMWKKYVQYETEKKIWALLIHASIQLRWVNGNICSF